MKSDYPSTIYPFWDNVGEGREKMDASKGRTHAVGCYSWGHLHYECALAEIKRLREALTEIANQDEIELALDPQWAKRIAIAAINSDAMPSTPATPA